jgi:hypothetical protein
VTLCVEATAVVVTVKVAVVVPCATVTVTGTVAAEVLLLVSETTAPPDGATPSSEIVPVAGVPPNTEAGLTVNDRGAVARTAVFFPTRSTQACPSESETARPVSVRPSRPGIEAGTSSRTQVPIAGRPPIGLFGW